jgi:excinuclease ABC subunit A
MANVWPVTAPPNRVWSSPTFSMPGVARRLRGANAPVVLKELETTSRDAGVIAIHGAREHNLKNLSVEIPRGKFVVVTGVSGSGKSTLAFDILFAEGQRRFLDSMSAYARQFVEQMARPDVDLISGLPPTVSIEQSTSRGGGKSTVATVTEVYHFIRLLYARLGTPYCPDCGLPVAGQTRDQVCRTLEEEAKARGDLTLLAPLIRNRKGFHSEMADWAANHGYTELRADGRSYAADDRFRLDRFKEHDVEVVTGVVTKKGGIEPADGPNATPPKNLRELADATLAAGKGTLFALDRVGKVTIHSTERACPKCQRSLGILDPKSFSYNSSQGWCPKCRGFGELFYLPDVERGANADSVEESWWNWANEREPCPECAGARLNPVARAVRLEIGQELARAAKVEKNTAKKKAATPLEAALDASPRIDAFARATVDEGYAWFEKLTLTGRAAEVARDIIPEIRERLRFLREVGLGYLNLGRGVTTLSGGEAQRIRLAAQLGSNLSGVLYVLDEPTIGLHARDNHQLLDALEKLQRRGNSLVVVEHDEDTMRRADWILDLGPGAGVKGGHVVATGTLDELQRRPESITGQCLRQKMHLAHDRPRRPVEAVSPAKPKKGSRKATKEQPAAASEPVVWLTVHRASRNNLKDLTVRFPLGRFIVVTGVSGSGKSTLVKECLLPALKDALDSKKSSGRGAAGATHVTGHESIGAVHEVDQSPIGRTPRSTPATYVGFFDDIRHWFAQVPEAKMRGYGPGRFSFNSAQGRCPQCDGAGYVKLEMNFLPPAHVKCELCGGRRFNPETLDIRYNGKNVAEVLAMSVAEAIEFFGALPRLRRPLEALRDTGLEYLTLGQTSPTLSGGEAQRVKLVTHLLSGLRETPAASSLPPTARQFVIKRSFFVLEEPTIGLHLQDVRRLIEVIQRLVNGGHTVVVIEHHLDLIAEADWVIDLGPEGGVQGGKVVAEGPPEAIVRTPGSHTGRYLREILNLKT